MGTVDTASYISERRRPGQRREGERRGSEDATRVTVHEILAMGCDRLIYTLNSSLLRDSLLANNATR